MDHMQQRDLQPLELESISCFTVGKACSAHWPPHLSMKKQGCLFVLFYFVCTYEMASDRGSWSLWKALEDEGCMGLIP
jgi:hypothetical protein